MASANSATSWIGDLGLDVAKVGLLLYVIGLLASSFYYSRFSILTLDLARTQSIVVGVYVALLYAAVPALILFVLRGVANVELLVISFAAGLLLANLAFALAADHHGAGLVWVMLSTWMLQFFCFADFVSLWRSAKLRQPQVLFLLPPPRAKAIAFALLSCVHFSQFWFPHIPVYFGGGRPLAVQVFTKTADLPASRFVISKNRPQINKSIDSFSLRLLYETDKDIYCVYDLQAGETLVGYSVIRLKKDEILRIDYNTPKWVRWKGNQ